MTKRKSSDNLMIKIFATAKIYFSLFFFVCFSLSLSIADADVQDNLIQDVQARKVSFI